MTRLATPQDAARWLHQRVRGALHTDSWRVTAGDGPAGSSVSLSRKVSCILDFSWAEAIF